MSAEGASRSLSATAGSTRAALATSFQRGASAASVASLTQSFLDDDVGLGGPALPSGVGATAAAHDAVSSLTLPHASRTPALRAVPVAALSNTRQAFFDEVGGDARDVRCGAASDVAPTEDASPPPAPPQSVTRSCQRHGTAEQGRGLGGEEGVTCAAVPLGGQAGEFTRRYETSSNPYLRAAALEMANDPFDAFPSSMGGNTMAGSAALFTGDGCGDVSGAWRRTEKDSHVSPALSSPVSTPAPTRLGTAAAPGGLRGYPLPAHGRSKRDSAGSCAPSMLQSMRDYAQMQVQEEALHWHQRCRTLELQLGRLQETCARQEKLLAAQWRDSRDATAAANATRSGAAAPRHASTHSPSRDAARYGEGDEGRCAAEALKARSSDTGAAADSLARASTRSPLGRTTVLTSRSPDSLYRTYDMDAVSDSVHTMALVDDGAVVECDDAAEHQRSVEPSSSATHVSHREALLGGVSEASMHYATPKPHTSRAGGGVDDPAAAAEVGGAVSPRVRVRCARADPADSQEVGGPTTTLAQEPARVSVEVQTDAPAAHTACFAREGSGASPLSGTHFLASTATQRNGTVATDTPAPTAEPPAPSAIMAKQYAEAVAELEALRVRLDVAERESESLRDMCVRQDLRCDDLETQLLAKEEQLLVQQAQQQQQQQSSLLTSEAAVEPSVCTQDDAASARREGSAESGAVPDSAAPQDPHVEELARLLQEVLRVHADLVPHDPASDDTSAECAYEPAAHPADPSSAPTVVSAAEARTSIPSLLPLLRRGLQGITQHCAALRAELEVVRSDRNELIGEQSEQVRQLQQQLLERETAQLGLMERLNAAEERLASHAAARDVTGEHDSSQQAVTIQRTEAESLAESAPAAQQQQQQPQQSPRLFAREENEKKTAVFTDAERRVLTGEVERLTRELLELKAAAAAGQETQRSLLSERLDAAKAELHTARLEAEDEYDRLSTTIEALRRELADAQEALRVKETALRIALRQSLSPAAAVAAATATTAAGLLRADSMERSPSRVLFGSAESPRLLREASPSSEASESARRNGPPSPPAAPPLSLSHLGDDDDAPRGTEGAADTAQTHDGSSHAAESGNFSFQRRGQPFRDDGTLRTLPSSVPMPVDDDGDGEDGDDDLCDTRRPRTTSPPPFSAASRDKSSRGLTNSTGGVSYATSTSLPRGRSDGSAEPALPAAHEAAESTADRAATTTPSALPAGMQARKSASARRADVEGDEELPLPLPLRSPLLGAPPTSHLPSSSRPPAVEGAPSEGGSAPQTTPPSPSAALSSTRPGNWKGGSLTPEGRLRSFLQSPPAFTSPTRAADVATPAVAAVLKADGGRMGGADALERSAVQSSRERLASSARLSGSLEGARTPARSPLSLLSERATPSSLLGDSPRYVSEVAARHARASLRRHRDVWQQQESLLQSLLSTPSP